MLQTWQRKKKQKHSTQIMYWYMCVHIYIHLYTGWFLNVLRIYFVSFPSTFSFIIIIIMYTSDSNRIPTRFFVSHFRLPAAVWLVGWDGMWADRGRALVIVRCFNSESRVNVQSIWKLPQINDNIFFCCIIIIIITYIIYIVYIEHIFAFNSGFYFIIISRYDYYINTNSYIYIHIYTFSFVSYAIFMCLFFFLILRKHQIGYDYCIFFIMRLCFVFIYVFLWIFGMEKGTYYLIMTNVYSYCFFFRSILICAHARFGDFCFSFLFFVGETNRGEQLY